MELRRAGAPLCACALLVAAAAADAQEFPSKPVRIVIGFPPGGPADFFARTLAEQLQKAWTQTVLVDNRAGAGGLIAAEHVAFSPGDGYTLYLSSAGAITIQLHLQPKMPYEVPRDLAPVSHVVSVPELLVVHPALPVKSVKDLVALARRRAGELTFGSAGVGGMPHLAAEQFKAAAAIDIVHVPFKGAAPAVVDLVAGHVQMMFADLPILLPQVKAGKLRALVLASGRRHPLLPDVPTTAEVGLPNVLADNWYGMLAPGKTAPALVTRLNAAVVKALQGAELRERWSQSGAEATGSTPEQFAQFIREETAKWGKVVRAAGVRLD